MKLKVEFGGWFVTAPAAFGAVGYLLLLFLPTAAAIQQVRADLRQKQEFIVADAQVQATATALEQEFHNTSHYCDAQSAVRPRIEELSQAYGSITQAADRAGVNVTRFEPQAQEPLESLSKVTVQMGVTGSFDQLQQLIGQLEQLQSLWVDEATLTAAREAGGPAEGELKLVIFAESSRKSG